MNLSTASPMVQQILNSLPLTIGIMNLLIHLIFAGAVARDAGALNKIGRKTYLVSGMAWAFATLLGGVFVAGLYWLMHYSTLARITGGHKYT